LQTAGWLLTFALKIPRLSVLSLIPAWHPVLRPVSFSVFFSLLCVGVPAYAQKGTFRGRLQDGAAAAAPLAYANVRVYKVTDNELAGGALSADNGAFSVQLPFGTYRAEVEICRF
jgi:hypothetical protein